MKKAVRTALAAALALATAPALAQTFTKTVFFGDSLTDSGFYRPFLIQPTPTSTPNPSAALIGKFTTNPGLVWAEILSDYYGSNGAPGWQMTTNMVTIDAPGNNYAAGGARVTQLPGVPAAAPTVMAPPIGALPGVTTTSPVPPLPVLTQVQRFLAENNQQVDAQALYSFWAGGNDAFVFQSAVAANPGDQTVFQTEFARLMTAAGQEAAIIKDFSSKGARYVMVLTLPNGSLTPSTIASSQQAAAAFGAAAGKAVLDQAAAVTAAYNSQLFPGLVGTRVIPVNTYAFLGEVAANPTAYGLSNATNGACVGVPAALLCSPANFVTPNAPETYLWADGSGHLTSAGHRLIAQNAISILEGPRQIAILPNSASMVGRARADRVSAQLSPSDADGMRWWTDVRGDFQRYDHGDNYDGVGPTLSVGVNWTSGNLVYGAFGGYGQQKMDWGKRTGSFDQSDASLGGFIGWQSEGGLWVNGQVSYSQLGFDVDRTVQLGLATRTHSGSPDGSNLSGGINAGWSFGEGALRHGPVLSVLAQKIEIDGYAESDPTLSTSLAYPEQTFDSMIGSAGWQVDYTIHEHLKPYARLTWDREFEDAPEEAFAQLQSMPDTAPYAVPGKQFDQDYGTLTFGARTQLFGLDANIGASATVNQGGGNNTTVFATIGAGF